MNFRLCARVLLTSCSYSVKMLWWKVYVERPGFEILNVLPERDVWSIKQSDHTATFTKSKKIHISAMWICPERTKNQFWAFCYFSVKAEYPEAAYTYESVLNCLTAIEWVQISDALRLWKVYLLKLWGPHLRVPKKPLFAFIMLNHIICLKNQVKGFA